MKARVVCYIVAAVLAFGVFWGTRMAYTGRQETVYVLIPMTGSLAELGQKIKGAVAVYVQNNNPDFEVRFVDSASSPDKAIRAIKQEIVNEERPIVVSAFSFISNAIIPAVDDKNGFVFAIATASINAKVSQSHHNFQRISTGVDDVITPLLSSVSSEIKTMSIVYSNDEYGMENRNCFDVGFTKQGGRILHKVSFDLSAPMSRESIYKVVKDNPDGIFVTGSASLAYINVFRDIFSSGYKGKIFADAAFSNTVVLENLGACAEGVTFVATEADLENSSSEKTRKFRQECLLGGVDPYFMTAEAYDVIALISWLKTHDVPINQESLAGIRAFDSVAEEIRFLDNGNCWYECCAVEMRDGRIVRVK